MKLIVAMDREGGIGKNGKIPWVLREDMKHFKELTTTPGRQQPIVIMGRKTWDSLPEKFRPLPGRLNYVLSRTRRRRRMVSDIDENPRFFTTFTGIPRWVLESDETWVIGGAEVYLLAVDSGLVTDIYRTLVDTVYDCDVFFRPQLDAGWKLLKDETRFVPGGAWPEAIFEHWVRA